MIKDIGKEIQHVDYSTKGKLVTCNTKEETVRIKIKDKIIEISYQQFKKDWRIIDS